MQKRTAEVGEIIDDLRRVFQVINEFSKRALRTTGLTGPQLWAIKTISEEAPVRVSDLARRMHLHPATVVGILDRLEIRELVRRTRSTEDRRVVMVELTAAGETLVRKAPLVAQGLLVSGLEQLPLAKRQTVAAGLQVLVDILGLQTVPPKLIHSPEVNKPSRGQGTAQVR
jgi:DNA-binding MarR family transcriptional regulator